MQMELNTIKMRPHVLQTADRFNSQNVSNMLLLFVSHNVSYEIGCMPWFVNYICDLLPQNEGQVVSKYAEM